MSKLTDKQYKILGRYMSTYDFVACNQLEKEAEKVLGKNWEAEDDVCHSEYEHKGVVHGLDRLISHLI
jgi:hypothetical protein